MSPKKKNKTPEYQRPEMGPGSESAQSSLRQIMAQGVAAWESDDFQRANNLDTRDSMVFPSDLGNQLADSHARSGDLYLVANRPEEAAQQYAAAVSVRPRFADLRFKLAEAYMNLDRLDDARDHLDAILEMHPSFHDARVRLGALLHRLDDLEGARREWERCAEADPEDRRVRAYLAALDT